MRHASAIFEFMERRADNSALAAGKVRELGFSPERVRAVEIQQRNVSLSRRFAEIFIYPVVNGVPLKELAQFYRQFSVMIGAGMLDAALLNTRFVFGRQLPFYFFNDEWQACFRVGLHRNERRNRRDLANGHGA